MACSSTNLMMMANLPRRRLYRILRQSQNMHGQASVKEMTSRCFETGSLRVLKRSRNFS